MVEIVTPESFGRIFCDTQIWIRFGCSFSSWLQIESSRSRRRTLWQMYDMPPFKRQSWATVFFHLFGPVYTGDKLFVGDTPYTISISN